MKQVKVLWSIGLVCGLIIGLLGGCGNPAGNSEFGSNTSMNFSDNSSLPPDSTEENPLVEPTESQFTENIPVSLIDGKNFSEGIAWIKYIDTEGTTQIGWLHPDGMVDQPFPTELISQYGSNFSGGYSYINIMETSEAPDSFIIINQSGEISAKSPADDCGYQIICGGDGVYLVKQLIRSITENEDRYGFISGDGSWLYECTPCEAGGTHPLSLDIVPEGFNNEDISFSYLGDGIFKAVYHNGWEGSSYFHRYGVVLYNALNKKSCVVDSNTTSIFTDSSGDTVGNYYEGWILVKIGDELYMLSSDFEKKPLVTDTSNTVIFSEGITFSGDADYHLNVGTTITNGKFYNADGSVLADLSQYELLYSDTYDLYRYSDGYAAIIIRGADGKQYLGIIDADGQFAFEPLQISWLTNWDNASTFSSGVIVCLTQDATTQIINTVGNQLTSEYFEKDNVEQYVFYEGYCVLKYQSEVRYLSTDGSFLETYIN